MPIAAYVCPACLALVPELVWRYGLQLCTECGDEQAQDRIVEDQQPDLKECDACQ